MSLNFCNMISKFYIFVSITGALWNSFISFSRNIVDFKVKVNQMNCLNVLNFYCYIYLWSSYLLCWPNYWTCGKYVQCCLSQCLIRMVLMSHGRGCKVLFHLNLQAVFHLDFWCLKALFHLLKVFVMFSSRETLLFYWQDNT